jgi:hypothetical protein
MDETLDTIEALEALPVKIDYVGEVQSKWDEDKPRTVDQWRVTFSSKAGSHSFDYFTGLGLRDTVRGVRAMNVPNNRFVKGHWEATKPKKPKVSDVLYSLILDASASDENFDDWCDNFGYSSDSIKALNIYKQCLDTARALRKHFSPDTLRQVRELLQDY